MNVPTTITIIASAVTIAAAFGAGVRSLLRAIWRAIAALERMVNTLQDHERRLTALEGRRPQQQQQRGRY
jgi:hypothetical protein